METEIAILQFCLKHKTWSDILPVGLQSVVQGARHHLLRTVTLTPVATIAISISRPMMYLRIMNCTCSNISCTSVLF